MRETIYRCDVCKRAKGETNHWYLAEFHSDSEHRTISISSWSEARLEEDSVHLCGQECVVAKVSEFLGERREKSCRHRSE